VDNNNNIPNSFDLPEDYFKNSKAGILHKIEWMQEHEAYPMLSALNKEHGFIIPENYFNSSTSRLELLDTPILSNTTKINAFEVPADYFAQNALQIISNIEGAEELSAYPSLNSIEKVNPFITSENYFETTKQTTLAKNLPTGKAGSNEGGAKIISLNRKPLWFAAAAVLTITFSLWIYDSFVKEPISIDDCTTLACLEKREVIKYKLNNFDTEEILDAAVDLDKLEKSLNKKENTDSLRTADSTDQALLDYID